MGDEQQNSSFLFFRFIVMASVIKSFKPLSYALIRFNTHTLSPSSSLYLRVSFSSSLFLPVPLSSRLMTNNPCSLLEKQLKLLHSASSVAREYSANYATLSSRQLFVTRPVLDLSQLLLGMANWCIQVLAHIYQICSWIVNEGRSC